MRCLLDTHTFIWWLSDSSMLPRKVRTIIADTEDSIYFSAVSSWQIVLKESIGKLRLPEEPALFILNGIVKNIWRCRRIFIGRR